MASITTRAGKGSPLTNTELDANFNNINAQLSTAVITGGTIDGATIGATTATTGKFSQLDVDNLRLDANTIISTDTNGNIDLTPNGTGEVNITKVDIDAGTIDGAVIGGVTPAAGSFTTLSTTGAITAPQVGSVIPFYYANQAAFPSASTYHGALAHSHSDGAMFFAHSSVWYRLLDASTAVTPAQGGTGVANNAAMTVTGSGNFAYTRTLTGTTNVTFPTTGTLATLGGVETFTGTKTFSGTSATLAMILNDTAEVATVSATAATGTIAYDITTQSVLYYTSNASANWTVNFRASSGTSLNTAMSTGQSVTAAFLVTQGATAYYNSAVQVDGSSVTPKYQGGTAYSAGNASSVDVYMYTIIKTGNAAFTVFTSQTKFA